jgi:hypothetical protein
MYPRTVYGSANAWRDAEQTEEPCRGIAWLLSAYSVSGQQAEASAYSPMADSWGTPSDDPCSPPLHCRYFLFVHQHEPLPPYR